MGRAYRSFLKGCAGVAALLLGATALAVTLDVIARNAGWGAFPWILEVSEYVLPLATFLAAPWLLVESQHVRLDVMLRVLPPRGARALELAANVGGLAISAVLTAYGFAACVDSARQGALVIKSVVFPEWWLYAPFTACFALLAVEFLRRISVREAPAAMTGPRA